MRITRRAFLRTSGHSSALSALLAFGADQDTVRAATVPQAWKIRETKVVPSVCPYCAVGCGQLLHVRGGELVNVEGNPDSPINRGNLCPKGAASYQLTVNPERQKKALYRAPGATTWEAIDLERAMEQIAQRVKATRDATFRRTMTIGDREVLVNHTLGIASLGGATMDNEWNYVQAKLWRGLGGVFIENQARI